MENLKSYLDGELDLAQKTEVETHLRNDAELQKMVEEFSAISSTLKTADHGEPYGLEKLEERLASTEGSSIYEKKKIWRKAMNWSAGSACLVILAMIMFPMMGRSGADSMEITSLSAGSLKKVGSESSDAVASAAAPMTADKMTPPSANETAQMKEQMKSSFSRPQGGFKGAKTTNEGNDAAGQPNVVYGQVDGASSQDAVAPGDTSAAKMNPEVGGGGGAPLLNGKVNGDFEARGRNSVNAHNTRERSPSADAKAAPPIQEPETAFKARMRQERDKSADPVTSIGDTPHGIYLERAGQVQVKVEDLGRSVNEATGMVQGLDGFVTASDLQNQADGGTATMTLRVPTKNFNAALDKLQSMGEVLSVNSNSQDITSETVDNSTRMISWADEEERLVKALNKAKTNDDKYRIQRQIAETRANLNAYRANVKSLTERAKYSTINCTFLRGDKATKVGGGNSGWSGDALRGAKDNLSSVGQVLGTLGIYVLVFSPVWLPFAIAAYVIRKKTK